MIFCAINLNDDANNGVLYPEMDSRIEFTALRAFKAELSISTGRSSFPVLANRADTTTKLTRKATVEGRTGSSILSTGARCTHGLPEKVSVGQAQRAVGWRTKNAPETRSTTFHPVGQCAGYFKSGAAGQLDMGNPSLTSTSGEQMSLVRCEFKVRPRFDFV